MRKTIAIVAAVSFAITITVGLIVSLIAGRSPPQHASAIATPASASDESIELDESALRLGQLTTVDNAELRRKILDLPPLTFVSVHFSERERLKRASAWIDAEGYLVPEVTSILLDWLTDPGAGLETSVTNATGARYRVQAQHDQVGTKICVTFLGNTNWPAGAEQP